MKYHWIISDIDGCLTPETSEAWNWQNFKELIEFFQSRRKSGPYPIPLILCTGRPQPYVEVLSKILDLRTPLICENGAVIYRLLENKSEYGPGVTPEKLLGLRKTRTFIENELLPHYPTVVYQFGKESQISLFSKQPEIFQEIIPLIHTYVHKHNLPPLVIQPSHYYLNISMTDVNKGKAIQHVLELLNTQPQFVVGIGDTIGDLPIYENVAYFACPNNATDEIKQKAHYISPYPDMQGLLDILHQGEFLSVWEN